jgi:hypothetical protein
MATEKPSSINMPTQTPGGATKPARPRIVLDLPRDEAMAPAQLTKHLDRSDCERLSPRHDGGGEPDAIIAAADKLQAALAAAGYSPR